MRDRFIWRWRQFWLWHAGYDRWGRLAAWLGSLGVGCHRQLHGLVWIAPPRGFIAPSARVVGVDLRLGSRVFIGERVLIVQWPRGKGDFKQGTVQLGDAAQINRECILELFDGSTLSLGEQVGIEMRCHFQVALRSISIGDRTMVGPYCFFSSGERRLTAGGAGGREQWDSNGPILIGRDAWLGTGAKVLSGVTIGEGAVVGAGSVVMSDIPPGALAAGNPARVLGLRADLARTRPLKEAIGS